MKELRKKTHEKKKVRFKGRKERMKEEYRNETSVSFKERKGTKRKELWR